MIGQPNPGKLHHAESPFLRTHRKGYKLHPHRHPLSARHRIKTCQGHSQSNGYTFTNVNTAEYQQFIRIFVNYARSDFVKRRSAEAARYQYDALGVWLRQVKTTGSLEFIQTYADKKLFIEQLDAAIKDPESSYQHKIRCALLVNCFYSIGAQSVARIIDALWNDLLNNIALNNERTLDAILPLLPAHRFEEAVNTLLLRFNDEKSEVRHGAATALGVIAQGCAEQREKIITALLTRLNDHQSHVRETAATALGLIDQALPEQREVIVNVLVYRLNDGNWTVREAAATAFGLFDPACPKQRERIVNVLLSILNDQVINVREAAVISLGRIGQVSSEKRIKIINALLLKLHDECVNVRQGAATSLGLIAQAYPEKRTDIINTLVIKLNEEYLDVLKAVTMPISLSLPFLPNSTLENLINLPHELTHEKLTLQLLARAQLHLNMNIHLNKQKRNPDLAVKFSSKGDSITQDISNIQTKERVDSRTLRFFTKAADQGRAYDDCYATAKFLKLL